MIIIAFSGKKQSGKDTAAARLIEHHGFKRLAFADVLKDMTAEQYSIPREWFDDPERKEIALTQFPIGPREQFSEMIARFMQREFAYREGLLYWTPRALLILEGSVKRSVSSQYWVSKVIEKIRTYEDDCARTVVSDARYVAEIEHLREAFGDELLTWRINRPELPVVSTDPSECDLDDYQFDFITENAGTVEEFLSQIHRTFVNSIGG